MFTGSRGAAGAARSDGITNLQGQALQRKIAAVREEADVEVALYMGHGRLCLVGLAVLTTVRIIAWLMNMLPTITVLSMHCLSATSDLSCLAACFPLYVFGINGQCVRWACFGPMMTMVFAMAMVDTSGIVAYFALAPPRPVAPSFVPMIDRLESIYGVWEALFFASVALQLALLASSWRIYRTLRQKGLYPPGNFESIAKGRTVEHVSLLEVVCEAEDVALIDDCSMKHCNCCYEPGHSTSQEHVTAQRIVERDG
jgi:hypothetical protein